MASIKSILIASVATLAAASPIASQNTNTNTGAYTILTTLTPTTYSQWNSGSSTVYYGMPYAVVQRAGSNNDVSTLMTFDIPTQYSGNTCELVFALDGSSAVVSGTGQAQIFFDTQAATIDATSDYRDVQIATLQAIAGGQGTFGGVDGSGANPGFQIACSKLIARPYLELAPMGDADLIYFQANDGLMINVLA